MHVEREYDFFENKNVLEVSRILLVIKIPIIVSQSFYIVECPSFRLVSPQVFLLFSHWERELMKWQFIHRLSFPSNLVLYPLSQLPTTLECFIRPTLQRAFPTFSSKIKLSSGEFMDARVNKKLVKSILPFILTIFIQIRRNSRSWDSQLSSFWVRWNSFDARKRIDWWWSMVSEKTEGFPPIIPLSVSSPPELHISPMIPGVSQIS